MLTGVPKQKDRREGGSEGTKARRVLVPSTWLALLITAVGVYATSLVYNSVVHGGTLRGLIGAVLLAGCVYLIGTPLAAAYLAMRQAKWRARQKSGQKASQKAGASSHQARWKSKRMIK